jgi:hypothetical protein
MENVLVLIESYFTSDRNLFWEEINLGYYQMRDEWIMKQQNFDPFNLKGRLPMQKVRK